MDDFDSLIEQKVDAIISFSSKWHVMGSGPQIFTAVGNEIPVIVLNAETDALGAYNLSNDSAAITETLSWMFKEMGGTGEFTYFVFGQNAIHQSAVEQVLNENPGITATQLPAQYDDNSVSWENIDALIKANPGLDAIWSDENVPQLLIAARGIMEGQPPYINCEPRDDWLEMWQEAMVTNPLFKCIATVNPGGTAYEGVYFAYYLLSGYEVNPDALTGPFGNTLRYNFPVITNENLDSFVNSLGDFRTAEWGTYEMAPMTPEEIFQNWFIE
jgi:ABC-type sugar transport system substrate-binding protein